MSWDPHPAPSLLSPYLSSTSVPPPCYPSSFLLTFYVPPSLVLLSYFSPSSLPPTSLPFSLLPLLSPFDLPPSLQPPSSHLQSLSLPPPFLPPYLSSTSLPSYLPLPSPPAVLLSPFCLPPPSPPVQNKRLNCRLVWLRDPPTHCSVSDRSTTHRLSPGPVSRGLRLGLPKVRPRNRRRWDRDRDSVTLQWTAPSREPSTAIHCPSTLPVSVGGARDRDKDS